MLSRRLVLLLTASALALGGCGSSDGAGDSSAGGAAPADSATPATEPSSALAPPAAADASSTPSGNGQNSAGAKRAIAYGQRIAGSKDAECGDGATAASSPADAEKDPGCIFVAASFACLSVVEPSPDFAPDLIRQQFEQAGPKILAVFDQALKDCAK